MGERTADVCPGDFASTISTLADVIHKRAHADTETSYTAKLLNGDFDKLLKKLSEESAELIMAVKDDDYDHIRYEAADLLYHLLVVLERSGVSLEELAGELNSRMQ